jgi:hypothetical protein
LFFDLQENFKKIYLVVLPSKFYSLSYKSHQNWSQICNVLVIPIKIV